MDGVESIVAGERVGMEWSQLLSVKGLEWSGVLCCRSGGLGRLEVSGFKEEGQNEMEFIAVEWLLSVAPATDSDMGF